MTIIHFRGWELKKFSYGDNQTSEYAVFYQGNFRGRILGTKNQDAIKAFWDSI